MKAVTFTKYGSPEVLGLTEVEKPVPKDHEVLVRVHAVSINDWDLGALQGADVVNRVLFGILKPKKRILGSDIAGRVEAVGKGVTRFRPGDEVFGDLSGEWGGFAEYVCARESALDLKSPGMSFEQAASIPQAGMLALQGLRALGPLRRGQHLLINGAGGGVGTFAIQMVRSSGIEVTAVDSPEKLEMLRSMGADHVVDYTREDFTKSVNTYDLILDVKTTRSIFDCARALRLNGTYVTVGGSMLRLIQSLLLKKWIRMTQKKCIVLLALKPNKGLDEMKQLFEAHTVVPVIDRTYGLHEVPEAFRYFSAGRQKGKLVITLARN